MPALSNPPQQWFELLTISDFGLDFGLDFGGYPQYAQETPQVVIVDGCWIQRESPSSNQR